MAAHQRDHRPPRMSFECSTTTAQGCSNPDLCAILLLPDRPDCSSFHNHSTSHSRHVMRSIFRIYEWPKAFYSCVLHYLITYICPLLQHFFKTSGSIPHISTNTVIQHAKGRSKEKKEEKGSFFPSYSFFPFLSWSAPNVSNVCIMYA